MTHGGDIIGDLTLRPLGAFDLAEAAAVHAGSFEDPWTERAIGELLAMPGSFGTLACLGDRSIGIALALVAGPDAEILTLGVLPDFRRHGIARRLLVSVSERVGAAGCDRLLLEVAEDNEAANTLYRRLGFVEIARRAGYYRRPVGSAVAAIVLARPLRKSES